MTFAQMNLNENIPKALNACGYTVPTPIQARSIPEILKGRDLVASAETGTGKTAAFVLPALHRLSSSKSTTKPRILILTPTRELAAQITQAANKYGKFLRFNIISLVGGMPYRQQLRNLSGSVDIIVATPGRLLDHMDNKRLDLSKIEMLFIDDVREIAKATPDSRQTLLFSATVDNKLSHVIRQLLKDPIRIDLSNENLAPALIKQEVYIADNMQHKNRLLQHFLNNGNIFKAIIFSATKSNADQLAHTLRHQGYQAAPLHGDLKQSVRNKTIEELRRNKIQFLVATDVAARGIDINDVTHVINYDLPKFAEDYVHRIGRTGRAGKTGIAISLALPLDAKHLQKIERFIGHKLEFSVVPGLEPTKRMGKSDTKTAGGKKSFGSHSGRNNNSKNYSKPRSNEARSDTKKSYARHDDSRNGEKRSYAHRDESPRSDTKRSYARRDESPRSDAKRSYARHDDSTRGDTKRSYARHDASPRSDAKRSYARHDDSPRGDTKRSYARNDASPRSDAKRSYARHDDSPRGDTKRSYTRHDESPRSDAKRSYARHDDSPRGDAKRSYARHDASPRSDAKRSYTRSDSSRSEGATPRSTDPRVSYGKTSKPGRRARTNYVRGSDAKMSFAKKPDTKARKSHFDD
jgi:superfamily II DNA/RNA helicase